jgi:transposase
MPAGNPPTLETVYKELENLKAENSALRTLVEEQAEQIRIMKLREYGRSSEKRSTFEDKRQGRLFDEAELHASESQEIPVMETVKIRQTTYQRRKSGRKKIADSLARVEVVVDLSEDEKKVRSGYELVKIGEDVSEQIHEVPQKYIVIKTIRPKYVKRSLTKSLASAKEKTTILSAPLPPRILPRSIATPSLLAHVLAGKFCDGLPFYRQEKIFARHGLLISRQDMANWTIAVSKRLERFIGLLSQALLESPYLNCDETWFQVMDEPGRQNTAKSFMWVMAGGGKTPGKPEVVLYRYSRTRASSFISSFLESWKGYLQTDGYAGYNAIGEKEGICHAGCWAHARRKFVEAHEAASRQGHAHEMINLIQGLYKVEAELRRKNFDDGSMNHECFINERRKAVAPVLAQMRTWLDCHVDMVLPSSALGKAIAYTNGIWDKLMCYLDSSWLTPDNNLALSLRYCYPQDSSKSLCDGLIPRIAA